MRILLSCLLIVSFGFIGCSNEQTETVVVKQQKPRTVDLEFVMTQANIEDSVKSIEKESNIFITEGYSIHVAGNVVSKCANHTNVNLKEPLSIVVTGNVTIEIHHPKFHENAISEKAFLGLDKMEVSTRDNDLNSVELNIIQGGIVITAPEELDEIITDVKILGKSAKFDMMYFTASEMVDVTINTTKGNLSAEQANVLGGRMYYSFNSMEEGLISPDFSKNTAKRWN